MESPKKLVDRERLHQALYSTALSLWRDRKRKYARRERIAPSALLDGNDVSGDDLEEDLISREERWLVRRQVDALPEKYRIPAVLYYSAEMKVSDIGKLVKKGLMEHDKSI